MNSTNLTDLVPESVPKTHSKPESTSNRALQWLLALAVVAALYVTKSLMVPMVVALLFALLLSPLVALFKRFGVPRSVSALLLVSALVLPFTLLGIELAAPAQKWAGLLPELGAQFTQKIDTISDSIKGPGPTPVLAPPAKAKRVLFGWFRKTPVIEATSEQPVNDKNVVSERIKQGGLEVVIKLLAATPGIIAQLLTGLILIVFLLIFGPGLFAAFITSFQKVRDKKRAIALIVTIQNELSRYIITVSIINTGLGLATALTLQLLGMDDALLWGVLVGLLNFAPYVGSLISVAVLALAGLAQYGIVLPALLPTLAFLLINMIENQVITPAVLGHHMRLNPLVLMIWLLIWGWLWGAIGVLLAVPLLVCIKLVAGHLDILTAWLKIIETSEDPAP